jgi:hypothetical protein
MASEKGKGGEGGFGAGDNVHSGSGSKSGKAGYSLPKGKAEGNATGGKDATFAEGGHSNHMFGEQNADEQKAGVTEHDTGNDMNDGPGDKFAAGGSGKMFGYQGSVPARAGITSAR